MGISVRAARAFLLACLLWGWPAQAAAELPDASFPEPTQLRIPVAFWKRVYLEVTTDGGLLHDSDHLGVVYEVVRFDGQRHERKRQTIVDGRRRHWRNALAHLAEGGAARDELDQAALRQLEEALQRPPTRNDLKLAHDRIRFQLGQRDKFRAGILRSGAYEDAMRAVFRSEGLPEDLAYLPHVESSFNLQAYSKYGAAGVWQFMRSTGRRFLRIDYTVDERLDPLLATRAAARLMRANYEALGSWPLAITAYNHGAAGVNRARRVLGTDDIGVIAQSYRSRSFGFASRNFYAQFLAARAIVPSYHSYFGPLDRDEPEPVDEIPLPFYADVETLRRHLGVSPEVIRQYNPSLRPPVFRSAKRIPKGFVLRLPAGSVADPGKWIAAVPEQERKQEQQKATYYPVRRGDTLGAIARRNGTSVEALVARNDLPGRHRIYPGQVLALPEPPERGTRAAPGTPEPAPATLVATAHAAPAPEPAAAPSATVTPQPDAPQAAVPAAEPTPPPDAAAADVATASVPQRAEPTPPEPVGDLAAVLGPSSPETPSAPATPVTPVPLAPSIPVKPAEPEGALVSAVEPPAAGAIEAPFDPPAGEPVMSADPAAEAAATSAAGSPPPLPDDSPWRRIDGDFVIVDSTETLGHFAEWLEVGAGRLRKLNGLRARGSLQMGQRLKLDFSRVSPEQLLERRIEYHKAIEEDFLGSYRITGTQTHTTRKGENLWVLTQRKYDVPIWLLHRYNPSVDLTRLVPGTELQIPVIESLQGS